MSSTDKIKLDGLSNYVHPTSGVIADAYKSVVVDAQGHIIAGYNPTTLSGYGITDATPLAHVGSVGTAHGLATAANAGFMSLSDKTKLDQSTLEYLLYQNLTSRSFTSTASLGYSFTSSIGFGKSRYTATAGNRIRIECVLSITSNTGVQQIISLYPTINGTKVGPTPGSPTATSTEKHSLTYDIIFRSETELVCISKSEKTNIISSAISTSTGFSGDIGLLLEYNSTTGYVMVDHLRITYFG